MIYETTAARNSRAKNSRPPNSYFLKVLGFLLVSLIGTSILVSGGSVIIKSGGLNVSNSFYVDPSTGNAGIGTTNPGSAKLNVSGDISISGSGRLLLPGSNYGASSTTVQILFNNTMTGDYMDFAHVNSQIFLSALSQGIQFRKDGGGNIMSLLDSGNVGIGTSTPNAKLQISSDSPDSFWIKSPTSGSRITMGLLNGKMQIFAYNDTSASSDDLILQGTFGRNVGIGTTNPASKLQVSGGYLQVSSLSGSTPPASDCDELSEVGRMVVYSSGSGPEDANVGLYVCLKYNAGPQWVKK